MGETAPPLLSHPLPSPLHIIAQVVPIPTLPPQAKSPHTSFNPHLYETRFSKEGALAHHIWYFWQVGSKNPNVKTKPYFFFPLWGYGDFSKMGDRSKYFLIDSGWRV